MPEEILKFLSKRESNPDLRAGRQGHYQPRHGNGQDHSQLLLGPICLVNLVNYSTLLYFATFY